MDELKPCPFCGKAPTPDYSAIEGEDTYLFHCQNGECPAWPNVSGETEAAAITAWNTRSPVTDEMVERAAKALEPFAKAAMGIKEFDPDFPLDGAALRASFDWYDKCQGKELKRNSVRLQDINFAAETHAALAAALGGHHGTD